MSTPHSPVKINHEESDNISSRQDWTRRSMHTHFLMQTGMLCPVFRGTLLGGSKKDKWLRYEGGLLGPVMAGWFSYNPIEDTGEA